MDIFPGLWDVQLLAIDSAILIALALSKVMHHRYRKPVYLVLTTVFACTLVLAIAFTVLMWSFKGYG